jgi:soluble lytic murein transglycosylase-like protein
MEVNQILQLIPQNAANGTSVTKGDTTDKSQAFTLLLDEMVKSMESNDSTLEDSEDGNDTFMGGSSYSNQMLELMAETIKQKVLTSPELNINNITNYNQQSLINDDSQFDNLGNSSSVLGEKNINSQISNAIDMASKKYNVEKPLIEAVIQQESAFNPSAVSGAGAQGLMQLMPDTARSLGVTNSFNANQNIDGGTKYLRSLLDNFNGNKSLALSAYNGGIGTMKKLAVNSVEDINKMPNETNNYIKKVIGYYEKYKK